MSITSATRNTASERERERESEQIVKRDERDTKDGVNSAYLLERTYQSII